VGLVDHSGVGAGVENEAAGLPVDRCLDQVMAGTHLAKRDGREAEQAQSMVDGARLLRPVFGRGRRQLLLAAGGEQERKKRANGVAAHRSPMAYRVDGSENAGRRPDIEHSGGCWHQPRAMTRSIAFASYYYPDEVGTG
jgi:hypothetical protein